MKTVLTKGFLINENKTLETLSVYDLFLLDTILSEDKSIGVPCKIFERIVSNILDAEGIKQIKNNHKNNPSRFCLFELIKPLIINNSQGGVEITNKVFKIIKKNIEKFLSSRNPYLLDIIKKKGKFKDKLWGINFLIEHYAFETGEHTEEVGIISKRLAREINERYGTNIDIDNFTEYGHFHDIGKLLIQPEILMKPGKLTPEEFEIIKKHTIYGSILIKIMLLYSSDRENEDTKKYADALIKIALYHHKTAISGYPHELKTDNITIESEIVRITDIFHALISQRSYKKRFNTENVWEIISSMKGSFKYPEVYNTFFDIKDELVNTLAERDNAIAMFEILGNDVIDSEHASIQAQLENVLKSSDKNIKEEYKKMNEIIRSHFSREEAIMLNNNYSEYRKHKKAHDEVLIRISFIENYNTEEVSIEFIKKFINVWLRKTYNIHSKQLDSKLCRFINSKGIKV